MRLLEKIISLGLVLMAFFIFVSWLPFCSGHPTMSGTPEVLSRFVAPFIAETLCCLEVSNGFSQTEIPNF
jgi:hypothetical protein